MMWRELLLNSKVRTEENFHHIEHDVNSQDRIISANSLGHKDLSFLIDEKERNREKECHPSAG